MVSYLASAIVVVLQIIKYAIVLSAILSFLPIPKDNGFIRVLHSITGPIILPIRNLIEKTSWGRNSMIDISPLIAYFVLWFLISVIAGAFNVPGAYSRF